MAKRDPNLQETWDWEWYRGLVTAEEYVARWDVAPPELGCSIDELSQDAIARARELLGR
jgi:hypothetical protein